TRIADVQAEPHLYRARRGASPPFRNLPAEICCTDKGVISVYSDRRLESSQRRHVESLPRARSPPAIPVAPDPPSAHALPLLLEKDALGQHAVDVGAQADPALRVHDAVPGHISRAMAHRLSHRTGRPRPAQDGSDLSIRHDPTPRNLLDETVHGAMKPD